VIIFCSVRFLFKKNNQTAIIFFLKTETGLNQPVSIRFGFFRQKPVQTSLAWFFGLTRFFPVLLSFLVLSRLDSAFFDLGLVRFFRFRDYKTETESNQSVFLNF
jgi:hypothetical protein